MPILDHHPGIQQRARSPLPRLLSYVPPHAGWASLTFLFGLIGLLLSFVYPWIIGSVVDLVIAGGKPVSVKCTELLRWSALAMTTGCGHAAVLYGRGHFNVHLSDTIVNDLRRQLFDHLQSLSVRFYTRERTGTIMSRVMNDVHDAAAIIYNGIVVAVLDGAQLIIAFILLCTISVKLTLACILVFPLYGLVFLIMNPSVRQAGERLRSQLSRISGNVCEQLSGQALVKTYTAERREAQRFSHDVEHHHWLVIQQSHAGHLVAALGEVLVHLGTTIVIGYGGWLAIHGELTVGLLTRFLGIVVILYGPVRRFAEINTTYQSSLSAMRRVFRMMDIQPSVVESADPRAKPPTIGAVRFEHVSFRYDDNSEEANVRLDDDDDDIGIDNTDAGKGAPPTRSEGKVPWVLEDINFAVAPGQRIAVVGASGAGKTTMLSLIPRLYDASQGCIIIDGTDVRDYSLASLRSAIAIVQQDSFVFSGSIRENIAYGRPQASDDEIFQAAKAAHAHEFIMRFPHGYDSQLGERGVNLSGGQRQRLSIARALLKDPRILILDEATSALDSESEAIVQQALDVLMRGRTCFIIAHRLSTIRSADRIMVLDRGTICEHGSHSELIAQAGKYARTIQLQSLLA